MKQISTQLVKITPLLVITILFTMIVNSLIIPTVSSVSAQEVKKVEASNTSVKAQDYYKTILSIPIKSGVFAYDKLDGIEQIPQGPNSISISDEGSFIIGNHVDNTVTELSRTGEMINKSKFEEATAIMDVVKIQGEFYALDRRTDKLEILSSYGYKVADAPTDALRLSSDTDSRLNSSIKITKADGQNMSAMSATKVSRNDGLRISPGDPFSQDANSLKVWRGKKQIVDWRTGYPIAETRLLGSSERGDFFVVVFELISKRQIILDQKVLHFNPEGKLVNQARVPQEQAMPIDNDSALSRDGEVFVLMPRNESMDIIQLKFKDALAPLTFVEAKTSAPNKQSILNMTTSAAVKPSVTRQQIANVANWYFTSSTFIPAESISWACRKKPSWLSTAKYYPSVAYSWGGADSPTDFANKMSRKQIAGHVADYDSTCSYRPAGVDCSGFVGQTWGMTNHPFATSSVVSSGYAYEIDLSQLRQGDALNLKGHHIVLFVSKDSNGVNTWEAAGEKGLDRALAYWRSWKDLSSYVPIRYSGLSITQPTARMTATSSRGIVYEYSTAVYTVSPGQSISFTFDSRRSNANAGSIDGQTWKINNSTVSVAQSFGFSLGRGTHNVSLTVTNTDGGSATATQQIVINEVQIVPPPRITQITPSVIKSQVGNWLHIYGSGFLQGIRAQVRTSTGGPWQIASSGLSYVNSGELWVYVLMGYGSYNATLELVNPNGVIASGQFAVRP